MQGRRWTGDELEVLKRMHELGLLDDNEVKEFTAMSLLEQQATVIGGEPDFASVGSTVDSIQHDPWWFDIGDEQDGWLIRPVATGGASRFSASWVSWDIEQCSHQAW